MPISTRDILDAAPDEDGPWASGRIVLVARNKSRGEATLARLGRSGPGVVHSVYFADLTRLAEMKRVAAEIANREPPVDFLVNNAGHCSLRAGVRRTSLKYTFALNHMDYFVSWRCRRPVRLPWQTATHRLLADRGCLFSILGQPPECACFWNAAGGHRRSAGLPPHSYGSAPLWRSRQHRHACGEVGAGSDALLPLLLLRSRPR